jgi:CheY-like chemotaxis protein
LDFVRGTLSAALKSANRDQSSPAAEKEVRVENHHPAAQSIENDRSIKVIRSSTRVLVVDDSEVNRRVATSQLRHLGYPCDQVDSAALAMAALARKQYQIILMDIEMPEMDGYEATMKIREMKSPACDTVVIAVTAHKLVQTREKCLAADLDDYISKPVRIHQLGKLLDQWAKSGRVLSSGS